MNKSTLRVGADVDEDDGCVRLPRVDTDKTLTTGVENGHGTHTLISLIEVTATGDPRLAALVRRQLEPNWHRVSWKTRQIVNDLTVLRGLLSSVLTYDAVSFLQNLDTIHADVAYLQPVVDASNGAIEFVGEDVMIGNGVGAGIRKGDTELLETWNTSLAALKADGTVDALIAEWFDGAGPFFNE
jgi:hypothetical protein